MIRSAIPAIDATDEIVPNCMNAMTPMPHVTMNGPKYGTELRMPAEMPHTAALFRPSIHSASAVTTPTTALVKI